MVFTPVGPFCPFRSSLAEDLDDDVDSLKTQSPEFAAELKNIQLELQVGGMPDKDKVLKAADELELAVHQWEALRSKLGGSSDFQTREYGIFTDTHLESQGISPTQLGMVMKWQSACLRSLALMTPPPVPPKDLDLEGLMKIKDGERAPSLSAMASADMITADPFDMNTLTEPLIEQEYTQLCKDHESLIKFGGSYQSFDEAGKLAYIDEIEKIEERWDIFYARFSLMGKLNPEFTDQCNEFMEGMALDENQYRDLLRKTHEIMREEAKNG